MSHLCLNPNTSYKKLVEVTKETLTEYYKANDPFEKAEYGKHLQNIQDFCICRAARGGAYQWDSVLVEAKRQLGVISGATMYAPSEYRRLYLQSVS